MTAAKREHCSRINKRARLFFDRILKCFRRKSWNARKIAQDFRSFRIQLFHHRIIVRHWRRGFDRIIGKTFNVGELQKLIELPLVTDGAAQASADVRAAG